MIAMKIRSVAIRTIASKVFAVALAALVLLPGVAAAQEESASKVVLENSQRILSALESRRAEFKADHGKLEAFVSHEFNATFDRDYAARQVLGRHARGASADDVKLFADALADSLMRRYGSSLLDFNTQLKVRIKSESVLPRGLGVKVSSELLRKGGEPIPVDYFMRKSGDNWKVFDVMVEGVSFVQTFRRQFDSELAHKSIKQVAAELAAGKVAVDAGG